MVKLQLMECGLRKIFQRFQASFQIGRSLIGCHHRHSDWPRVDFENHQAYIQQNDVFVGALTVEEHLFLQSKVKFCKIFPKNLFKSHQTWAHQTGPSNMALSPEKSEIFENFENYFFEFSQKHR